MRCKRPLEGAKWSEGYLRALLQPPQYPTLGEYLMNDPNVIEAHIDWAADHGIDCFICNWEGMVGHRKFLSENLVHILQGSEEEGTLCPGKIPYSNKDSTGNGWDAESMGWSTTGYTIRNLQRMKFSILFESRLLVEQWPPNLKEKEVGTVFGNAITYCAENFFGSPQWQRIDGKPVVYLYEVWSWLGDTKDFQKFRKRLDAAVQSIDDPLTGEKFRGVYIIADLMYPYVEPQERFACFDAITGYQPYPPITTGELSGYAAEWQFYGAALFTCPAFQNYHKKYVRWCEEHGLALIPCVIPRYNDRGVRGACDHFAFPPASQAPYTDAADVMESKLFVSNIKAMLPYINRRVNMLNINSWNEWFEDTAIEPCGFDPSMPWPDWFGQGSNIGTSTVWGLSLIHN
ncbi:MAG: glycoside hydrolase family 99-like domain-containing protein, partial [Desulfovibrionaceae bacterium]|nr:glycoside hydrolase family 99-like domain-containing protein [Desulfovibrionaceae bacterium]